MRDSEILFLYDAKLANPNGDPDEENRPRMDEATGRNLVSDVRLKRYIRDYWLDKGYDVWVRRVDGRTVDAKGRMDGLVEMFKEETGSKLAVRQLTRTSEFEEWLLKRLIDVRFFGATMPMQNDSITFIGPVQFTWGYSLHPVEINPSATISSLFAGRTSGTKAEYGTFGKDWRVMYSFIGFYGIVSSSRATHTLLSEEDIKQFDTDIVEAIPAQAVSRSKVGQTPRLYLRVEYAENENGTVRRNRLGDLRGDIALVPSGGGTRELIRDIRDFRLDTGRLLERLEAKAEDIGRIVAYQHPDLQCELIDELSTRFGDRVQVL